MVEAFLALYLETDAEIVVPFTTRPTIDVVSFFAIGDLSHNNGLPALGTPEIPYNLPSGNVLHTAAEKRQVFPRAGGGLCLVVTFKRP